MAELVDASDLGSDVIVRVGSNPIGGTFIHLFIGLTRGGEWKHSLPHFYFSNEKS